MGLEPWTVIFCQSERKKLSSPSFLKTEKCQQRGFGDGKQPKFSSIYSSRFGLFKVMSPAEVLQSQERGSPGGSYVDPSHRSVDRYCARSHSSGPRQRSVYCQPGERFRP